MPLSAGDKLGPYEIVAPLGAGGMGEVYHARDCKLDRNVAIKVLPAALAGEVQYMARFEREAQMLAALNHPNIATVHGIEQGALVMELVDGADLKGPLPLDEVIAIARQIAAGLEAAHEKGVIHRDLKPANIKLTPAGVVKILDFGLAKSAGESAAAAGTSPTMSPTLSLEMTRAGMILGTAAYMSPEQARGKPVDKRTDIWAFGVVLYEMLTGRQLYGGGETVTDTLASVVKDTPDLTKLPAGTPPHLRHLLDRCLRKDAANRLRDIGEARIALEGPLTALPETRAVAPKRLATLLAACCALVLLALAGLGFVHFREAPAQPQSMRFQLPLPGKWTAYWFSLSPDGRYLVMGNRFPGQSPGLWIRPLDSLAATARPGTEGAYSAFWSPDSTSIAFFAQGKLKRIAAAGGPPQTICDAPAPRSSGTWNQNGVILFSAGADSPLMRVSAAGGVAVPVTGVHPGEQHYSPRFLPDGRHFLYVANSGKLETSGVYAGSLDGGSPVRILPDTAPVVYVLATAPPQGGYLLFPRQATLMAQPFDAGKLRLTGDVSPVVDRVSGSSRNPGFSAAVNGVLVYNSQAEGNVELLWLDRAGRQIQVAGPVGGYDDFRLSPDETNIAFDRNDAESGLPDIWVLDTRRQVPSRLTSDPATENLPIWSPDGSRVLFPSNRNGAFDLYSKAATGAGAEELLVRMSTPTGWGTDWSRDGRFILYQIPGARTGQDLWIAPQFGDRKPYPYLQTQFSEQSGMFSPDGRWIAYVSDESGHNEVYVQCFPLSAEKRQISTNGGTEPSWRKDGSELFYLAADRNLTSVPMKLGAKVEAGLPKALFAVPESARRYSYAVTGDGQSFLVSRTIGELPPLTVIVNWQAGWKR